MRRLSTMVTGGPQPEHEYGDSHVWVDAASTFSFPKFESTTNDYFGLSTDNTFLLPSYWAHPVPSRGSRAPPCLVSLIFPALFLRPFFLPVLLRLIWRQLLHYSITYSIHTQLYRLPIVNFLSSFISSSRTRSPLPGTFFCLSLQTN